MSAAQRQQWYRIGDVCYSGVCNTSKEWLLVGRKFEGAGRFEEAAQCYCRAIRLNPHCPAYYYRLGIVQCEIADWAGQCTMQEGDQVAAADRAGSLLTAL